MTNRYDNQTLHAYLLGQLPEEDVERLDEMTFTDPDFAEELNSAEKDLVDAYVNGELKGEDLLKFESHYLASPLRRKKVTFARALNEFGAEKVIDSPFAFRAAVSEPAETGWLKNLFAGRIPILGTAAAFATVALILFGAFLAFNAFRGSSGGDIASVTNSDVGNSSNAVAIEPTPFPTQPVTSINVKVPDNSPAVTPTPIVRTTPTPERTPRTEPSTAPVIAAFFLPPPLRGAGELINVKLEPKTEFADFSIGLETNDFASYRIELRGAVDGRQIWQARSARSHSGKSLNVRIPAKLLKEQIYSFTVEGISAAGTSESLGDYSFRVMR